ncbi:MAG: UDP-2,4-diacetamido-2,4,6-trideoxy-beta-L-altropyranose hydrolase [Candidatus Aminicenantes bacterium]|nr:UDP-2,4-diacetamido-2,4,6-trideoxy-beta-L-altropyranose hydrolase [Candidatus Aminicenantes bacterium]
MKITILTEGGAEIGFGHVTRCLSLCQAFAARRHHTRFIVAGDASVAGILKNINFEIFDWRKEEERLMQAIDDVDVALVDSYLANEKVYETISASVKVAVFLDDTRRLDYPPGLVLNWSISARDLEYPEKDSINYLLGPAYVSLRNAFREVPAKEIKETVTDVLVTFGGDDSKNLTPKVQGFLTRDYPTLRKHIVIAGAFKNRAEIEAAADNNTHLVFSPDDEGMKKVMLESDIAIASGGQTIYELARVGVPAVVIAVADNQRNNVSGWEKTGFIENAGFWNEEHLMNVVAERFAKLTGFQSRRRAAAAGHNVIPCSEADQVIKRIEDKLDVYNLFNCWRRRKKKKNKD